MSAGMDRALILIGVQFVARRINDRRLRHLGEQNQAADGRPGCRNKQAMVAARIQADDAGRSDTTDAVTNSLLISNPPKFEELSSASMSTDAGCS